MANKDDRKIVSGVVVGDTTYTDVDELAKVITPEQVEYLTARGAITGTWEAGAGGANYSRMKVDELKALAEERGIEGAADMKKADLVAALEAE